MRARLERIETLSKHIQTFWFAPQRPVRYTAGQFTELHLPHDRPDGRGERRWFTLSSSPTEPLLGITTKFELSGGSSFKAQLAALRPGIELNLTDPMGDFVLPKDPARPLVFVAAGLGITPVRSMIKWLHDCGERRNIKLLYAASPQEVVFEDLFKHAGIACRLVTSDQRRVLNARAILDFIGNAKPLLYISGPELLVETLYKDLQTAGIHPDQLVADYFPGYSGR